MFNETENQVFQAPIESNEAEQMRLWKLTESFVFQFLEEIKTMPTFRQKQISPVGQNLSYEDCLTFINEFVVKNGMTQGSPNHMAHIPASSLYISSLAGLIVNLINQNPSVNNDLSPGAVFINNQVLNWFIKIVGYNKKAYGHLTSGGSMSNFYAVQLAKQVAGIKPEKHHKYVVYITRYTHHSIFNALIFSGLENCVIREVDTDIETKISTKSLEACISKDTDNGLIPWLIVATAGYTETGAVDPLDKLSTIAEKENLWLHVDAAYGGFFLLCKSVKPLFSGLSRADSISLDPHKSLFMPLGIGAVLYKTKRSISKNVETRLNEIRKRFDGNTNYLKESSFSSELNPLIGNELETSKSFRGLPIWLALNYHGVSNFSSALNDKLELAKYFCQRITQLPDFEVVIKPMLTVVTFRYVNTSDPCKFNRKLLEAIMADGEVAISAAKINNKLYLRAAILCFRGKKENINLLINKLISFQEKLSSTHSQKSGLHLRS